ncbi:MAG: LysM peptidoglycan-binding domain-containing protein, partial [Luminiphilus sp.]|nr:LysM peptidoglycan-binding domain-containing protein [Luminiphilus sp.]
MFEYNDLGYLTASNEGDGLWRTFGVDAMGSKVHTTLLGDDRSNSSGIESFKVFDARGLVRFIIAASGDSGRAIKEKAYDYERRVSHVYEAGNFTYTSYDSQGRTAVTYTTLDGGTYLAGAKEFHYDDVSNVIGQRDALGHYTQNQYDLLGNRIRSEDAAGDVQVFFYDYTGENSNRLTDSYYVGTIGSTREQYDYDTFGQRTAVTKVNVSTENGGEDAVARVQYNQAGELIQLTDAENRVTKYWYNGQGKQEWVQDANGKFFGKDYDEMGRLTKEYSFASDPSNLATAKSRAASGDSSTIIEESIYDIYGNLRATISPEGDRTNRSYGDFGRIVSSDTTAFIYDNYGRRTQEYSSIDFSGIFGLDLFAGATRIKNITREYNAAGQLTEVNDLATDTRTTYSYDLRGNRLTEKLYVTADGDETLHRDVIYSYNANGELTRWADNAPGIFQTYSYFDDGNIASINSDGSTKAYTYDAANRVTSIGDVAVSYNYLGARASEGGVSYKYDKTGWLEQAGGTTWSYDNVGNILTRNDGSTSEVNIYDYAYRVYQTTKTEPDGDDDGDEADVTLTTTTFDRDGKTLTTKADETTFTYTYNSAGLVTKITGSGADSASGSSRSSYDENGRLSVVNRGSGDDDSASTLKTFAYDNDGRIISRATVGGDDAGVTYYLYGNGNPLGEYQSGSAASPTLNTGNYSVFQTISSGFGDDDSANPASSITQVTIQGGESLKSLAAQNYGSPDLWYLIADANGLKGSERLEAGTRLVIPNNANNAFQTAETNALYKEGDIVGSKLPNLTTPPPEEDECAKITAIILIVVVAIVAVVLTVVTVGAAAPAAAAALGFAAGGAAAIATGVVVGAVIGAAIAFAASAATQGILVGFGLQESFDWDAVLADTVAGAFGGAAAGLGAAVSAGRAISTTAKIVNVVGQIALESAGEAASQAIQNDGRVDAPWLVVAAGAGGALGGVGDIASRTSKAGAKLGFAAGETGIAASFGSSRGARTAVDASAKLAVIDDVAAVAKKAGKGKWGVFKDAFRYQVAEIRGTTFTQTLAKTGKNGGALKIGDKAAEFTTDVLGVNKKLVRTISPLKVLETGKFSGLSKVDYSTVARVSSKTDGVSTLNKIRDGALNLFKGGTVGKGSTQKLVKSFRNGEASFSVVDRVGKSFRQRAFDAIKSSKLGVGLSNASDAARDGALNLIKGGTVGKGATQKLVKSFKNGQPVYEVVNRVGQSSLSKFTDGALNLIKGGTVGKGATQKLVKSFKNGQPVYEVVNRVGQSTLSKAADAAAAGLNAFGKKVSAAVDEFINPITEVQKAAQAAKVGLISDIAIGGVSLAAIYVADRIKAENPDFDYQASIFKTSSIGRRGGLRFASGIGKSSEIGKFLYRTYRNIDNPSRENDRTTFFTNYTFGDFVDEKIAKLETTAGKFGDKFQGVISILNGSDAPGSESFNDIDARNTYADRHDRQHKYIPIRWFDVAAGATSTVFSPFAIDRAGTLETNQQSIRLVSGEVSKFDTQSIIAFAERSVGGV